LLHAIDLNDTTKCVRGGRMYRVMLHAYLTNTANWESPYTIEGEEREKKQLD